VQGREEIMEETVNLEPWAGKPRPYGQKNQHLWIPASAGMTLFVLRGAGGRGGPPYEQGN